VPVSGTLCAIALFAEDYQGVALPWNPSKEHQTMIQCIKCGNDTRTSELATPAGPVALAGTIGSDPQPILAQVCIACGYIELYAPQPVSDALGLGAVREPIAEPAEVLTPVPSAAVRSA
jgi:predicted nucleic-acid-binding Zn-ribbon protein